MPDKVEPKLIEKVYELNARRPKKSEDKGSKKVSQNTIETYNIVNGISKNLQVDPSSLLTHLHIMSMTISTYGWDSLGKGIAVTKSLQNLTINLCEVNRDALKALSKGMKTNSSIQVINLAYNNIKDSDGDLIAKIVSYQTQNRDQLKWKGDLRTQQQLNKGGLTELHLQYNKLGGNFILSILNALKYDEYIKVLDLRKNLFSTTLLEDTTTYDLIRSLQRNESITNIDFRGN